jgi:hypothetical protein
MGKIFNMESNNSPEFNALVSLYSGKGKKFITRQYKLDAEAVNRVIAVKAMLDETAGWIKNGEVKSVRIDNADFLKICNLDEVFMAKNDNGQIILSSTYQTDNIPASTATSEPTEKKGRFKKTITKDIVIGVKADVLNKVPKTEIVKKYGISASSIYRIIKNEYDGLLTDNDTTATEAKEPEPSTGSIVTGAATNYNYSGDVFYESNYTTITGITNFDVALTERHDMPCEKHIFGRSIPKNMLFDFDQQATIVKNYIKENFNFDESGKCLNKMKLYTSGLQSILAACISVCNEMRIPLSIMHYNIDSHTYEEQVVFPTQSIIIPSPLMEFCDGAEIKVYKYNDAFFKTSFVYSFMELMYADTDDGDTIIASSTVRFYRNRDDAYSYFKSNLNILENEQINATSTTKRRIIFERISVLDGTETCVIDVSNF